MAGNLNPTLVELKQQIQYFPVGDRQNSLKWLTELSQEEHRNSPEQKRKINRAAVHQICDRIRSLPVRDGRWAEEIVGYNQWGGLD
ncbi:hypothetical protein PN466_18530 [Roseofilum reptotaenium CS-1145]|uniref:Uncharacterized protein n=1 Tax=Roseofilum reptotaenium AO1-A TaxID=1925591 RepID=A0A1L9QTE4_9CYAN|nr:hypothetical protein [Roseofilum reptotaenium]MDB9518944.1 hypothetical protein [Roseofilum reptotaenium CS-1145]OJJ25951.1 hypothetical protein BI308_08295 [Roseofilum reptotaenium AO1-A]